MLDDATCRVGDKVLARLGFAPTDLLYQRLGRVLQTRMRRLNFTTLDEYLAFVERGGADDELGQLAEALTINETYLFREPKHFESLKKLLPEIARTTDTIRILSAGCASGEEVYTLAMTASRMLGTLGKRFEVVGVDVDASALAKGRDGLYSRWSFREEGLAQAQGFIRPEGEKWRIVPRIRETVSFQQINLIETGIPGPFHIVFCRNMLMYLTPGHRKAVIKRLIDVLPPGGVWFLGSSESLDEVPAGVERIACSGAYYYRKLAPDAARGLSAGSAHTTSHRLASGASASGPLRIVTATNSPLFRVIVRQLLRGDAEMTLLAEANDAASALAIACENNADLVIVDAINALEEERATRPAPAQATPTLTIVGPLSPLQTDSNTGHVLKLSIGTASSLKSDPAGFIQHVRAASRKTRKPTLLGNNRPIAQGTGTLTLHHRPVLSSGRGTGQLVSPGGGTHGTGWLGQRFSKLLLIGSSTGGPAAVSEVLSCLPPGLGLTIVIVQHMPANFTRSFAERLDRLTEYTVSEAATGLSLNQDTAFVAPGGMATTVGRHGAMHVVTHDSRQIYVPNIDRTFTSVVAAGLASRTIAVIMTGMGDDGADGLLALQKAGAATMVQDPQEAVVPGMVNAALARGAGQQILNLQQMADAIVHLTQSRARAVR